MCRNTPISLADSRATALIAAAPLAQTIWPIIEQLPHLRTVILVGATAADIAAFPGRDVHLFEDVIAAADTTPFTADTVSDEVAFWMYTSGSTGDPKGVKHVHSNLMATARLFGQGVLGISENDVVHSAAKLFFAYGLGNAMTFPLSVGATAALWPERPSPESVFEMMRKHRPTIFYGVPSLYTALLSHPDICKGAGSDRLRLCVSAGEALPAHIGERWRKVVGVDVLDGIGSTELLQTFLSNRPGDIRYGSTGKPVPGYEARIVDEKGRELGADEIGELIIRGPSAAEGYWNQRAKSQRTFVGEWTYTGDKFRRDADGYYYYCGRTDDMFKVSGMWVSPFDVEAALTSHEAVLEAAVIGKQDADGLIKPKAFIVLKNGYVADDGLLEKLKTHVKEQRRRVEISALDRRAHRLAAHRHRQDPTLQAARRGFAIHPHLSPLTGRGKAQASAIFTYSKSPGLLSMPTLGGAIQLANLPGSHLRLHQAFDEFAVARRRAGIRRCACSIPRR